MAQEIADVRAAFTESAVKVYRSDGSEVDI
jgi:hypothetical protein